MKILVTAGATREPIDDIRYISNFSTGHTGAILTEYFAERDYQVTHLMGRGALEPKASKNIQPRFFDSFTSLESLLMDELRKQSYDAIIHSAAVGDFSLASPFSGKLESSQNLQLSLKPNPKLILKIRSMIPKDLPQPILIAFKLTHSQSEQEKVEAISKLSFSPGIDFVVHNDYLEIKNRNNHPFSIYQKNKSIVNCMGAQGLAHELFLLIRRKNEL